MGHARNSENHSDSFYKTTKCQVNITTKICVTHYRALECKQNVEMDFSVILRYNRCQVFLAQWFFSRMRSFMTQKSQSLWGPRLTNLSLLGR